MVGGQSLKIGNLYAISFMGTFDSSCNFDDSTLTILWLRDLASWCIKTCHTETISIMVIKQPKKYDINVQITKLS